MHVDFGVAYLNGEYAGITCPPLRFVVYGEAEALVELDETFRVGGGYRNVVNAYG